MRVDLVGREATDPRLYSFSAADILVLRQDSWVMKPVEMPTRHDAIEL